MYYYVLNMIMYIVYRIFIDLDLNLIENMDRINNEIWYYQNHNGYYTKLYIPMVGLSYNTLWIQNIDIINLILTLYFYIINI